MFSSWLALFAAAAAQGSDPVALARESYTGCLRTFMDQSIEQRTSPDEFNTAIDTQCAREEAVLRDSVIQRGISFGDERSLAEEDAQLEVDDARTNFRGLYRTTMEPQE